MFKILTLFFFLYYFKCIFSYHSYIRGVAIHILDSFKKLIISKGSTNISEKDLLEEEFIKCGFIGIFIIIFSLIEIIYIFFSIAYVPLKVIPVLYLIYLFFMAIKPQPTKGDKIVNSINDYSVEEALKKIDNAKKSFSKISILNRLQSVIKCSFFGYIIYILYFI